MESASFRAQIEANAAILSFADVDSSVSADAKNHSVSFARSFSYRTQSIDAKLKVAAYDS